ncbi:MAG: SMC-Scp complex subunit ScpB [Parcubacteria group bacterium]|nr:SMC-Scp complex subunit ScpB [Parcubacteria group bacterium]
MSEHEHNIKTLLEALLLVSGAPISVTRLARAVGESEDEVRGILVGLKNEYAEQNRGMRILEIGDEVQLGTAPEAAGAVEKLVKEEFPDELTPATLETLAIVVYRGPIPRAEIDFIRGVNSSYILRSLLIRGLITREPDSKRSNVWLYKPSFELLQLLGVTSRNDLPDFSALSKKLSDLVEQPQANEVMKPQELSTNS